MTWKLELEEEQANRIAVIIDALKTERAQGELDHRRSTSTIADTLEKTPLDDAALETAARQRVESEGRVQAAVTTALRSIHELLDDEQRKRFAHLVRTGVLQL